MNHHLRSRVHWPRDGSGFWPGEYSKTYALARQDYGDIMYGLRNERIWVTTRDLISGLDVSARGWGRQAGMGETLIVDSRGRNDVDVEMPFQPLVGMNFNGDSPPVRRVDLIVGHVTGPNSNLDADTKPTPQVVTHSVPTSGGAGTSWSSTTRCATWNRTSTRGCAA